MYLGTFGSQQSRAQYDRIVAEWLANGRRLSGSDSNSVTSQSVAVVELAAAYLQYAKVYYRKNGQPTSSLIRVRVAIKLLKQLYGHEPIASFGPLKLRALQQKMVLAKKARRYVNHVTQQVKRIFKWGVSMELVPAVIFQALATVPSLPKGRSEAVEPPPVRPVSDEDVRKTLPYLPQIVADMVVFQRLTGCRPGEVCIVRPCDLDTSGDVWVYTPHSHKTEHHGKRRVILVGPKGQDVLRPYLSAQRDAYCFSPNEAVKRQRLERHLQRKTPLTSGSRPGSHRKHSPRRTPGTRYTTASYGRAIRRAAAKAGLPAWLPNRLRHSAATEIRKLFGAEAAQVVLGHSRLEVTELYAERDIRAAAAIMAKIG